MKKNKLLNRLLFVLSLPILILGCDSDDDAGAPTGTDFASIATSYNEADGNTTLTIPFRNASSISESDLIIDAVATEGEDYDIVGVTAEGIQISFIDDDTAEDLETIRISISGSGGNAIHTIRLLSDDPGVLDIDLSWEAGVDAADMDLLLWKLNENEEWEPIAQSWGVTFEHLQMHWKDEDGTYGLTYNYYDGSADPLDFKAEFTPTSGVTIEGSIDPLVYNVTYTADNKDKSGNYHIVQTFKKTGTVYSDFTEVEVPASGSRSRNEILVKLEKAIDDYKAGKK